MNKSKIIYTIAGLLLIAAAIIIAVKIHAGSAPASSSNTGDTSQPTDQTQQAQNSQTTTPSPTTTTNQNNQTAEAGCPNGTDPMAIDATHMFIPTINIANKAVILDTNYGQIKIAFYDKDAPKTVENFICLAQKNYYNGTIIHRIVPNFVIQGGDPTGTGSGGTSIYGDKFEDELYSTTDSYKKGYTAGTVAMANSGPNTNGSQFFIMLADVPLDHNYTIFGHVISGMDVVNKIAAVPASPIDPSNPGMGNKPNSPVTIKTATVEDLK